MAEEWPKFLREDGIEMLLETEACAPSKTRMGIQLYVRTPDGGRTLAGSHLLVRAAGRQYRQLDLDAAGARTDKRGFRRSGRRLETNCLGYTPWRREG